MSVSPSISTPSAMQEVDTFEGLEVSERLLVWGGRTWVACCRRRHCPMAEIKGVFSRFGVTDAAASLDALLGAAAQHAIRSIAVQCPVCAQISDDEVTLLSAASAAQRHDPATAQAHLQSWLPAAIAEWALGPLHGLGVLFARAGLVLPLRHTAEDGATLRASKRCHLH
jgi:hypothetical protein